MQEVRCPHPVCLRIRMRALPILKMQEYLNLYFCLHLLQQSIPLPLSSRVLLLKMSEFLFACWYYNTKFIVKKMTKTYLLRLFFAFGLPHRHPYVLQSQFLCREIQLLKKLPILEQECVLPN